ncbi:MAG: MFS transporter [Anaerolineae bacterium]|jgi:MFS family permease|nr:MFS transporter [Anaerolineae bacterium]
MRLALRLRQGLQETFASVQQFNHNIRLLLIASILGGIAGGIIDINFNLYVLSLGISPDSLGQILSAGPFAHVLSSIPIGFLGEVLGYRTAFLVIYAVTAFSQLVQAATGNAPLIAAAGFVGGLAVSGNFVVRIPFLAANSTPAQRVHVFTLNSVLSGLSYAVGSLLAGYLPNMLQRFGLELTLQYRYTLIFAGALTLLAVLPMVYLHVPPIPTEHRYKISLSPYLWGIERFTLESSAIELFIGLTLGLIIPFMNIFFIYNLGVDRESYSTIVALSVLPVTLMTIVGPSLVSRYGKGRTIAVSRYIIPFSTVTLALTANAWVGTGALWTYRALFTMSQALWFAFAMDLASEHSKMATSAWLEITFWLGQGVAALITGALLARSNYSLPFYLSTGAALVTALLTHRIVRHKSPGKAPAAPVEV